MNPLMSLSQTQSDLCQRKTFRVLREPPFVGRTDEIHQIMQLLAVTDQDHGQVVLVRGPAGIGKSRLIEEITVHAQRYGALVAIGRCWRNGEAPPLWPWRMLLRELDAPDSLLAEQQPETASSRFARFVAVLDYLRTASQATSLLLILDDAHLADPATLLLTRFLARERRKLRLLLLLTRRDDVADALPEVKELLAELEEDTVVFPLAGLTDDEVSAYLSACGCSNLSPELLCTVSKVTKGNPLHLRSVVGRNTLGGETHLEGLEQAIARIIEQLSGPDRRLVGLAALLGMDASLHEVARLADMSPSVTAETLAGAITLGIMVERPGDRVSFVHERVRDVALAFLGPAECLAAHARAARLLTGPTPERMLRRAHHAFIAASRSIEDAATAVRIAREAATALQTMDGFEQAAGLLGHAVELHETAALTEPAAALIVEWAEAILACGRLTDARPLFHRAARAAEAEGDSITLARAALGLGGVWVREHRLMEEAERVAALQRRALATLPEEATILHTRLTTRLAAEHVYRGGPVAAVEAGVDAARRTGDARALAEALSLCHHALLTPEHARHRLSVAHELITVASVAGDGVLSLIGLCWRAVDLFLLGDPAANTALAELRLRADTIRCQSILFIVRAMEVMLAVRAGQFTQAEQLATACYELGSEVGDADALAYYGAHLAGIRVFQGREAELADLAASIATSPTLTERDRVFSSAAALFALRGGHPHQARVMLEGLKRDGLCSIVPTSAWLLTMLAVVELAAALKDSQTAQAAYDALAPYAELPIMASLAVVCFGSVHRPLALAALTCGKIDLAIEHFTAAVKANERLGHRPAAIQARADLALALLQRAGTSDERRGRTLIQEASAEAETLGMSGLVVRWREALAAMKERTLGADCKFVSIASAPQGGWRVALGGHIATVPDLVGMRYVAQLVAAPNQDIPAVALVADTGVLPSGTSKQEVMDSATVNAVRERIRELRRQPILTLSEQEELNTLTHELASACGLGGRIRAFADIAERARTAVRKAIKRTIAYVSAANPVVGRHLAERIETGSVCCYRVVDYEENGTCL